MFQVFRLTSNVLRLSQTIVRSVNCRTSFESKHVFNWNWNFVTVQYYTQTTNVSNNPVVIEGLHPDVDIQNLTNGDPEIETKLRVLVLETDVMLQEGSKVPELQNMRTREWKELLSLKSRSQRTKYLLYLWKIERKKENRTAKKEQARVEYETRPPYEDDGHIRYGLNYNTFLIRIYDSTINQLYNHYLIQAMQFGQKLIIDCGYERNMTKRENKNCSKQIMNTFADNRLHEDPFDLHLCNTNKSSFFMEHLERYIPTMYEPWFPLNLHPEHYLNLFPKEKLVYLTPDCREELTTYDHDAIYIIGAIVDKVNHEPLSLAKAKSEGIRMAKLPLDRYLQWGSGSGKSLTINQMIAILLDMKSTGNWEYALRHVPRRKIITPDMLMSNKRELPHDRITQRYQFKGRLDNKLNKNLIKKLMDVK